VNLSPTARGRIIDFARFLIAAALFWTCNLLAASITSLFTAAGFLVTEAVFRSALLLSLIAAYAFLARVTDPVPSGTLAAIGLPTGREWRFQAYAGFLLGSGMITLGVAAIGLLGSLEFVLVTGARVVPLVLLEIAVLAVGAMAEEVAFRGYPFKLLVSAAGPAIAIAGLSLLFGLAHLQNPNASTLGLVNTVLVGVMFAVAYLRTGSLWLPWGIHFGWNLTLGAVFGLPVSGLTHFGMAVRGVADGPQWLTGGAYGLEASLTAAIILALGFPVLLRVFPVTKPEPQTELAAESRPLQTTVEPAAASNLEE
jgi:membrane protease YdiL (CAAX protease family)